MTVRLVIAQTGVGDAGHLVGQGASGLVVVGALLQRDGAGAQAVELGASALRHGGCPQHAARAVDEQHAQIGIALFADCAESTSISGRVLLGRETEPTGEVTASVKWVTSPEVAATKAVLVNRPMPGTVSSVVHADWC